MKFHQVLRKKVMADCLLVLSENIQYNICHVIVHLVSCIAFLTSS